MNYQSRQLWTKLARHQGNKLVPEYMDCSPKNIRRLVRKLGLTIEQFKDWSGLDRLVREYRNLEHFQERNPNLKLFELQGQLLEMLYEDQINRGMFD
ncbi:MAG: hypothetical protein ACKOW2_01355 [Sphingobacteriaceae bacterium]